MKTKLYHKVLKMAWKMLKTDPRPSTHSLYCDIYNPRYVSNGKNSWTIKFTPDREIDAKTAYTVWTCKLDNNKYRYSLHDDICKKYEKYSRRYFSDESILKRIIKTGKA